MPRKPKPYAFFDEQKDGKTWKVKLHVPEGFLRIETPQSSFNNTFPQVPALLANPGIFPQVNSVTLLKQSNTFIVRLNVTYAWDAETTQETIQEICERLDVALETGKITYVSQELQDLANEANAMYEDIMEQYPRLPEADNRKRTIDPLAENVYDEDDMPDEDLFNGWLQGIDIDFGDDDDDDFNGNVLVPVG